MIKDLLLILKQFVWNIFPKYWKRSYAQEGEDMILARYFDTQSTGFFADIGAHHPKRFSNTYAFYRKGWRGINIDAMPGSMKMFNVQRKEDINIEAAISAEPHVMNYHIYSDPALNSFSNELTEYRISLGTGCEVVDTVPILTRRLEEVLNEKVQSGQVIDFMSVDVEGLDLEVLQSNNWQRYRPRMILCEMLHSSFQNILNDPVSIFLKDYGYHVFGKCVNTVFFRHDSEIKAKA